MTHSDSFINEVTDEVRRDRLFGYMRRYGWIGIVAVIAVVGGASWVEWQKYSAQSGAQAFGDQVMKALQSDDAAGALKDLKANGSQAALAKLAEAGAAGEAGKSVDAAAAYKVVMADTSVPRSLRDLAGLKAVMLPGDAMSAEERKAELEALSAAGAPFRPLAMEQQAIALVAAGDKAGAIAKAQELLNEPGLTPGLQQRANELIVALGGTPSVVSSQIVAQ